MSYDKNDDEIFDEIYKEFSEEHKQPTPDNPKKKLRIKWINVAILIMAVTICVLVIFLITHLDDMTESKPKTPSSSGSGSDTMTSGTDEQSDNDINDETSDPEPSSADESEPEEPPKPPYPVDADITVIDGVTYMNGILIINKTYSVPESFDPGVDPVAEAKLKEMYAAAAADGLSMWTASGYRTYEYQRDLYENYAARDGFDAADTYSARPGHSEHETGLTFDINDPSNSFDNTAEAAWLAEHCAEYGFIIRYPKGKEDITGFMYESWHVRYVGEEVAAVIMENGICLEEYFGITSQYEGDYNG